MDFTSRAVAFVISIATCSLFLTFPSTPIPILILLLVVIYGVVVWNNRKTSGSMSAPRRTPHHNTRGENNTATPPPANVSSGNNTAHHTPQEEGEPQAKSAFVLVAGSRGVGRGGLGETAMAKLVEVKEKDAVKKEKTPRKNRVEVSLPAGGFIAPLPNSSIAVGELSPRGVSMSIVRIDSNK